MSSNGWTIDEELSEVGVANDGEVDSELTSPDLSGAGMLSFSVAQSAI
jgi:hypothetical protein